MSKKSDKEKLQKYIDSDNIVDLLEEEQLQKISNDVLRGLEEDKRSMSDWLEVADRAMELTQLKREEKNRPFRGAANIKFPIITTAVLQWASRSLADSLKNGKLVDSEVIGHDPSGVRFRMGQRRATHLNYQIMKKMPRYIDEAEQLLQQLAVTGTSFTKVWHDPIIGMNRCSMIPYDQFIVNNSIKDLHEAPRQSQYIYLTKNQILEQMRSGLYSNIEDIDTLQMDRTDMDAVFHELVECHNYIDLDDDSYEEPYITTIHIASGKVVRVVARYDANAIQENDKGEIKRITPEQYFTGYTFIPSLDGSFFGIGFGILLIDSTSVINTSLNQLINAGSLSTMQGGFLSSSLKIKKEDLEVDPGEYISVPGTNGQSLKDNIVPFNYKEPSQVLLSLLQYLIESCKSLTGATDIMTGSADTTNVSPNTLNSLLNENQKLPTAINTRIARCRSKEIEKLVKLNAKYLNLEEYIKLINPNQQELQEMFDPKTGKFLDYDLSLVETIPVVDLTLGTKQAMLIKANTIMTQMQPLIQAGQVDGRAVARFFMMAMEIDSEIVQIMVPPPPPPQPNPEMVKLQQDAQFKQADLKIKAAAVQSKAGLDQAKSQELQTKSVKNIADADANHAYAQLDVIKTKFDHDDAQSQMALENKRINLDHLTAHMDHVAKLHSTNIDATLGAAKIRSDGGHVAMPKSAGTDNTLQSRPHSQPMTRTDSLQKEAIKRGWRLPDAVPAIKAEAKRRGYQIAE